MKKYKRYGLLSLFTAGMFLPVLLQACILVVEEDDNRRHGFHGSEWYLEVVFYRMETFAAGDREIEVAFGDNKLISGSTACGAFQGLYTVDEFDNLSVESLASDNDSCADESTSALFLDQLGDATKMKIDGDRLRIDSKGSNYLTFDRK